MDELVLVYDWLKTIYTIKFTGRTVIFWERGIPREWERIERGKF